MPEEAKISVVMPVHNIGRGKKTRYFKAMVKDILSQDYRNLELILVENFSVDNSLAICQEMARQDKRIIAMNCTKRGTTMARKFGIEKATGKYIVSFDQDDRIHGKNCIRKMYEAIEEDKVQICEFGEYSLYLPGVYRARQITKEKQILSREELMKEIVGFYGSPKKWSTVTHTKIYDAETLKSAASKVTASLYHCEDLYLNVLTFFDPHVQRVSKRPGAYYMHRKSVGLSGESDYKNILATFAESEEINPMFLEYAQQNHVLPETLWPLHEETIYWQKAIIDSFIRRKFDKKLILDSIAQMSQYRFVQQAKEYFRACDDAKVWDELRFLISDYTPETYYDYCAAHLQKESLKQRTLNLLSRLAKAI